MSYDTEEIPIGTQLWLPFPQYPEADPRDLAVLVTTLEFAAIALSPVNGSTFTKEDLFREARDLCGSGVTLLDVDLNIVWSMGLGYFLKKVPGPGGRYMLK